MFKSLKKKFNTMIETPTAFLEHEKEKEYVLDQLELQPERVTEEMGKINIHGYLEDLKLYSEQNTELLGKGKILFGEIIDLIENVKDKMAEIGQLFGDLSSCSREIEAIEKPPDINQIQPKVSTVYNNLKTSFLSWSNLYEHQKKNIKKLFNPTIEKLTSSNEEIKNVRK